MLAFKTRLILSLNIFLLSGCLPVWDVNQAFAKDYVWIGNKTLETTNGEQITGYWRRNIPANQYEKAAGYLKYEDCNLRFTGGPYRYYMWDDSTLPLEQVIPAEKVLAIK